jgi:CRP/FNR family cyclic AMP-dependent transcriptional regulator
MHKRVADYRELLRAGRWFRGLPEAFQDALVEMSHVREVVAHEVLFSRGAPSDGMFGVLQGKLRVSGSGGDGKQAVLTIVEPPGWVGELGFLDGIPRSHDLTADIDSLVVHVPTVPLLALLEANPRYWRDLSMLVTAKLRLAFIALEDAALSTPRERIARRLVMIADGYGQWTDRTYPLIDVSQETLATMVTSSRQTVNQVLRKLEIEGLVKLAYGGVEVLDLDGLRGAARGGASEIPLRPSA